MKHADLDEGRRADGLTTAERGELVQLEEPQQLPLVGWPPHRGHHRAVVRKADLMLSLEPEALVEGHVPGVARLQVGRDFLVIEHVEHWSQQDLPKPPTSRLGDQRHCSEIPVTHLGVNRPELHESLDHDVGAIRVGLDSCCNVRVLEVGIGVHVSGNPTSAPDLAVFEDPGVSNLQCPEARPVDRWRGARPRRTTAGQAAVRGQPKAERTTSQLAPCQATFGVSLIGT